MAYSKDWDEDVPANTRNISLGDDDIRNFKYAIRERLAQDHQFVADETGDSYIGYHKWCKFIEAADIGTGAEGYPILGAQTADSKAELTFTDEDDTDVQITSGGYLDATSLGGVYAAANVASLATMMALIYPVGSVVTLGVSTNPATLYGIGTWTAITGTVIVGIAGSGTFNTLDATGGAETVTLDETMIPAHTHAIIGDDNASEGGTNPTIASIAATGRTDATESTGGGLAHSNLQPYIVKYVWQRTA